MRRPVAALAALSFGTFSLSTLSFSAAQTPDPVAAGAVIYSTHCMACHQAAGEGIEGAFPALAGSAFVVGDAAEVVKLPLHGRGGMPNFGGELSDDEIAAVVSFIRNSWGNKASLVDAALVAELRSGAVPEEAPTDPNARPGAAN